MQKSLCGVFLVIGISSSVIGAIAQEPEVQVVSAWNPERQAERPAIRLSNGKLERVVRLPGNVYEVTLTRKYSHSKLIVFGRSSAANVVIIVNPQTASIDDQFLSFAPSVSPTGRFIAFQRFETPLGPAFQGVTGVYDLEKPPAANRLTMGTGFAGRQYAGRPVFPPRHVGLRDYMDEPKSADFSQRLTPYYWLDSDTFAFISYQSGRSSVIAIEGNNGFARIRQKTYPLDHNVLVRKEVLGAGDDPALQFGYCSIRADGKELAIECPARSQFTQRVFSIRR